tara:strand:- start:365 stop:1198 length:834 start_codon:yes stop_codon:yes gene_type:complete
LLILSPIVGEKSARERVGYAYAVWTLLVYNLRAQHGRAVLGVLWTLLVPLIFLAVYVPILSGMMSGSSGAEDLIGSGRLAFPVYVLCGFLPWMAFVDAVQSGGACLASNAGVVHHSPIPLTILPIVKVLNGLVGLLLGSGFLFLFLAAVGRFPGPSVLLFPVAVALLGALAAGLALLFSALTVYVRDMIQIVATILQIEFFAAPLLYTPDMIGNPIGEMLIAANPMTPYLNLFRASFIREFPFAALDLVLAVVYAAVALIVGTVVFRKLELGMADHV